MADNSWLNEDAVVSDQSWLDEDPVVKASDRSIFDGLKDIITNVGRGAEGTARSASAFGNTVVGDLSDVELISKANQAAQSGMPAEQQALMAEIQKRKAASPDAGIWQAVKDVGAAALDNKMGTAQLIAEQAPNSAVALGGGWAGAKAGALAGSALGPAGAVAGGALGFVGGMFLGNYLLEGGGKAMEKAQDGFTKQDRADTLTESAVKAGVITGVDALTLKLGGTVSKALNRTAIEAGAKAEAKVLMDAGINVADPKELLARQASNPDIYKAAAEAGKVAAKEASTLASRGAQAGTLLGMESVGEGAGEYLGELAATGKADPYDAALEAISSFGQSFAEATYNLSKSRGNEMSMDGLLKAGSTDEAIAYFNNLTQSTVAPLDQAAADVNALTTEFRDSAGLADPAPAGLPNYSGPPLVTFPDGSTMTAAEAEQHRLDQMVQPSLLEQAVDAAEAERQAAASQPILEQDQAQQELEPPVASPVPPRLDGQPPLQQQALNEQESRPAVTAKVGGVNSDLLSNEELTSIIQNPSTHTQTRRAAQDVISSRMAEPRERTTANDLLTLDGTTTNGTTPTQTLETEVSSLQQTSSESTLPEGTRELNPNLIPLVSTGNFTVRRTTAKAMQAIGRLTGTKVKFFSNKSAEGMYRQGNEVWINMAVGGHSIRRVFGHEVTHQLRANHSEAWDAVQTVVASRMKGDTLVKFYRDYFSQKPELMKRLDAATTPEQVEALMNTKGKDAGYGSREETIREILMDEMVADLGGNRFGEDAFWTEVFDNILKTEGSEKGRTIIEKLKDAMVRLIRRLEMLMKQSNFEVDQSFTKDDLAQIRTALASAYAKAINEARTREDVGADLDQTFDTPVDAAGVEGKEAGKRGSSGQNRTLTKEQKAQAQALIPKLMKYAERGFAGRNWYENSAEEVLKVFNGDIDMAEKFIRMIAITSPSTEVGANTTKAVKAWRQFANGEPFKAGTENTNRQLTDSLYYGKPLDGIKTNTFYINLYEAMMGHDSGYSTQDMHMGNLAFGTEQPSEIQYQILEEAMRRMAKKLGVLPRQAQAMVWVPQKVKHILGIWKDRGFHKDMPTDEKYARAFDFAVADYQTYLVKNKVSSLPVNQITQITDEARRALTQTAFLEAVPSESTPEGKAAASLDMKGKADYTKAVFEAAPPQNVAEAVLGRADVEIRTVRSTGGFQPKGSPQGKITPNVMVQMVSREGKPITKAEAVQVAVAFNYVYTQDGVPVARYDSALNNDPDASDIVRFTLPGAASGEVTPAQEQKFYRLLESVYGVGIGYSKTAKTQITAGNYTGLTTQGFYTKAADVAQQAGITWEATAAEGEYIDHDWNKDPNGDSHRARGINDPTGRSDLQARLAGWRNDAVQASQDWLTANGIKFSEQRSNGSSSLGAGSEFAGPTEAGQLGAVSATGIHYSKGERRTLVSSLFGTGLKGAELERIQQSDDKRIKHRIYFYVNTGRGINQEFGVGPHAHKADLSNVYDVYNDPLDLKPGRDANELESAILDSGFDGYLDQQSGIAVLLGQRTVPVEYLGGNNPKPTVDRAGQATPSTYQQQLRAVQANTSLPGGQMTGADWKRMMPKLMPEIDVSHLDDETKYYKAGVVKKPEAKMSEVRFLKETTIASVTGNEFDPDQQFDTEPVDIRAFRLAVKNWADDNLVSEYTNSRSGLKLEVRRGGVKQALQHGGAADKLRAFAAVPDILERGVVVFDGINPKIHTGRLVAIAGKVDILGRDFYVTAGFREDANGRLFYDHELMEIEKAGGLSSQSGPERSPAPTPAHLNDITRQFLSQDSVKESTFRSVDTESPEFKRLSRLLGSSGMTGGVEPNLYQAVVNGLKGNAEAITNLLESRAFLSHGYRGLDVPAKREMLSEVISASHNDEVLRRVVASVPVDVMNLLTGEELSAEALLRDKAMLKDVLAVDRKPLVSLGINKSNAIGTLLDSIALNAAAVSSEMTDRFNESFPANRAGSFGAISFTGDGAEKLGAFGNPVRVSQERFSTARTFDLNHDETPSLTGLGKYKAVDVNSQSFLTWFAGSKVVDSDGKPLVVYHGTDADIKTFDPKLAGKRFGIDKRGIFFAISKHDAYTGGVVYPVYLSLQNPVTFDILRENGIEFEGSKYLDIDEFVDSNKQKIMSIADDINADGIFLYDGWGGVAVAFEPGKLSGSGWFADVDKYSTVGFKSREKLIEMPIDDFLLMAKEGYSERKEQTVKGVIESGNKFNELPALYFKADGEVATVDGHEGRHRARELKRLGYRTMPVMLKGNIRWSEQSNPERFDYKEVWPKVMIGEDGGRIEFPVERENSSRDYKQPPTQIKSAISNTGEFSDSNPDIRYSLPRNLDDATKTLVAKRLHLWGLMKSPEVDIYRAVKGKTGDELLEAAVDKALELGVTPKASSPFYQEAYQALAKIHATIKERPFKAQDLVDLAGAVSERFSELRGLNARLVEDGYPEGMFVPRKFDDGGVAAVFSKVFGTQVVYLKPARDEAKGFLAMQWNGAIYVDPDNGKHGFINLLGHELLHDMAQKHPGIYSYFAKEARAYVQGIDRYADRLARAGADEATDTYQEILADFVGDSLADEMFLQLLADANPTKFRLLVESVRAWLGRVSKKLANLGSDEYVSDVDQLRETLAAVLDTYSETRKVTVPVRESAPRSLGTLTPDQEKALKNVGGITEPRTLKDRIADLMKINIRQGLVDQFDPIKNLDQRAYMMSRLSKGADGTLEAAMLYGKPYLDGDTMNVDVNDPSGGFAKVLATLNGEHDRFLWYIAALRAQSIKRRHAESVRKFNEAEAELAKFKEARSEAIRNDDMEGYRQAQAILEELRTARDQLHAQTLIDERLFGDQDISALLTLNQGKMKNGESRAQIFIKAQSQLNEFNNAVLETAKQSGLIDQAAVDMFKDQPYVPFYRVLEDGDMPAGRMSSGMTNQRAWKSLKGGREKLNEDLLANMLMNWSHIYQASAKNRAAAATLAAAKRAGVAEEVPTGTKGSVKVMVNGKQKAYMLDDPYIAEAIAALEWAAPKWMKPLADMKRWLTWGVTVSPFFKIKNLIRDSVSAIGQSDLGPNVLKNWQDGWSATRKDGQTYASMLAGGGVIRFGTSVEDNRAKAARRVVEKVEGHVLDANGWQKLGHQMRDLFDAYQELGDKSENINRGALYDQLIKKGYSHAEASFMARDLLDFSMSGRWEIVRFFAQTVPFLNARLQGLYKLGRAAKDNPVRMGYVVGAVTLASLALLLAYSDDEDWKNRKDWDRDTYWWFKIGNVAFRIPKPFEIGTIGTIAERTAEALFLNKEKDKWQRYRDSLSRAIFQTFAMDLTPQAVKPIDDLRANKDSFGQRPIETMAMQRMRSEDRVTENTSQTAILLSKLGLPNPYALGKGSWDTMSPVQIDYLIRGYGGWAAASAVAAADMLFRPIAGKGKSPDKDMLDWISGKMVDEIGKADSSRYVEAFYDQAKDISEAKASYDAAIKVGDIEQAKEIKGDNPDLLRKAKLTQQQMNQIGFYSRQIKKIEADKEMDAETKRRKIDTMNNLKASIARTALTR